MLKHAILNVADTGPVESLIIMLRSIGYKCYYPSEKLKNELKSVGCDTVLSTKALVDDMGYEYPLKLQDVFTLDEFKKEDHIVFVDVKGHRNYKHIVRCWPNLENKVLWYRINGSCPEHVTTSIGFDCGDETNPPCPVLTPNMWYKEEGLWLDRSYVCWPPFYRVDEYFDANGRENTSKEWTDPICLIHNVYGWGYGLLVDQLIKEPTQYGGGVNLKVFGRSSPVGVIKHEAVPIMLKFAKCMIHLKSNDAPGYALYEAMAAGCPIICSRRLIWRSKMQDLLIPGETCLVFDRETHDPLSVEDVKECTNEIRRHLKTLSNPEENNRIGMNGYRRLKEIMWSENKEEDVRSLREFMERMFG